MNAMGDLLDPGGFKEARNVPPVRTPFFDMEGSSREKGKKAEDRDESLLPLRRTLRRL